jgi:hypothetical protein
MLRTTIPDNPFEIRTVGERKILFYQNQQAILGGIFANTVDLTAPNFDAVMDVLESRKNNFFRHWMIAYWVYYTTAGKQNSCPFKFSNGRWDLRLYNDNYFLRLRRMLAAARKAGIIVQLTIFDRCGLSQDVDRPAPLEDEPRWTVNPWNKANNVNGLIADATTGLPEFFNRSNTALARLQDAYVTKVAMETREFSNVVYEIMNEPMFADLEPRMMWANDILKVLSPLIQGRRLIFYNDHSSPGNDPANRGKDVNHWRDAIPANISSYKSLDGVIFHGNPNIFDPTKMEEYGWTWRKEQLLQLSSDGFTKEISPGKKYRDDYDWNKGTATKLFGGREIFQAETNDTHGAEGIRDATPPPTKLHLMPFMGCWDKTAGAGQDFNIRFDNNDRYVAFIPATDQILAQGRVVSFTDTAFSLLQDGQTTQKDFTYSLSPDWKTLTYTGASNTQTFVRIPFDFESLLFGWEKIAEDPASARPRFFLYFKMNGAQMSFTVRDPDNQQNIWDQGFIREFKYYPPQLLLSSQVMGEQTQNYEFTNNGQNLKLHNPANNRRQTFKRII